jgi:hypothetical protein
VDGTYFCTGRYAPFFDERKIPWRHLEKVEEKAEGEVVDSFPEALTLAVAGVSAPVGSNHPS